MNHKQITLNVLYSMFWSTLLPTSLSSQDAFYFIASTTTAYQVFSIYNEGLTKIC